MHIRKLQVRVQSKIRLIQLANIRLMFDISFKRRVLHVPSLIHKLFLIIFYP